MSTSTNTPAAFGYVTGHTAGGGAGGARHIIARTGTHFNGYAAAAICGTAPAGRWGTGSSAIRWTVDMNLTGEYGDTLYSTPAEAAAARPVCRRCAAAAAKMAAATVTPEAAPVEVLDPAEAHKVTILTGGRTGERYTAVCTCGKRFDSTHNTYRQRAIKLHLKAHGLTSWTD